MAKKSTSRTKSTSAGKPLEWNDPANLLATWFGLGRFRFAPGTWGSLGAFPLVAFIFAMVPSSHIVIGILACAVMVFFAGLWACDVYIAASKKNDPKEIVIDEVAGQLLALAFITFDAGAGITAPQIIVPYCVMFFLFRYFDIWKPWPCKAVEKLPGGWGVMLDDIVAAIYAIIMFYALAVVMALILAPAISATP